MGTTDKILLWQTIAIALGALVTAPITIWAMFRQTRLAARIAQESRRQECVERLLALASHRTWPQTGRAFYRALNSVPVLFAFDRAVLEQFRLLREDAVHRDPARGGEAYARLLTLMAGASHLTLTEADINATFGPQWGT